ncbi:hypothetical protein D3C76_1706870 [compost metagenome]
MNLDALHIHFSDGPAGFQHHFVAFLGQSVNNMGADADVPLAQLLYGFQITLGVVSAIY